jgi:magnesium-transporting ATPase (P-type)
VSVPVGELERRPDTHWYIKADAEDTLLADRRVDVQFTVMQVSLFFSIYVFFQVWNQINCRSLSPRESGFHRIWENPTFLVIASIVAVGQILIVTLGGPIFKVQPLPPLEWFYVILFTSSVLIFAEITRQVRVALARRQAALARHPGPTVPRG